LCALPKRPGATELAYVIGGKKGRRCSYAVLSLQPSILGPFQRDTTSSHQLLIPAAAAPDNAEKANVKGAEKANVKGQSMLGVRRSIAVPGGGAAYTAGDERARLAQRVASMAGVLDGGQGERYAVGLKHGWVSSEGLLGKSRAQVQAQLRGDSTPSRSDFLFSKADRLSMAMQLQGAHNPPQTRACRHSLLCLSSAAEEARVPWIMSEEKPLGKVPMRRQGHTACAVGGHHIVVFGGCDDRNRPFNDIHILDCAYRPSSPDFASPGPPSRRPASQTRANHGHEGLGDSEEELEDDGEDSELLEGPGGPGIAQSERRGGSPTGCARGALPANLPPLPPLALHTINNTHARAHGVEEGWEPVREQDEVVGWAGDREGRGGRGKGGYLQGEASPRKRHRSWQSASPERRAQLCDKEATKGGSGQDILGGMRGRSRSHSRNRSSGKKRMGSHVQEHRAGGEGGGGKGGAVDEGEEGRGRRLEEEEGEEEVVGETHTHMAVGSKEARQGRERWTGETGSQQLVARKSPSQRAGKEGGRGGGGRERGRERERTGEEEWKSAAADLAAAKTYVLQQQEARMAEQQHAVRIVVVAYQVAFLSSVEAGGGGVYCRIHFQCSRRVLVKG